MILMVLKKKCCLLESKWKIKYGSKILMVFVTGNSSLEPLLEGLFAQIHIDLS